jgi:hypothetical protein
MVYISLIVGLWKIKNGKIKILILILGFVLFFVNPIRFKQEGGAQIERSVIRFDSLPPKVDVEADKFQQRQDNEMKKLKQQTEDLKNEIHD